MSELEATILKLELEAKHLATVVKELVELAGREVENTRARGRLDDPHGIEARIKGLRRGLQDLVASWTVARKQLGDDPLVGKTLGPCRLERKLREGSMCVLFMATHVALKRPTIIKVLRAELSGDADLVARLQEETLKKAVAVNMGEAQGLYYVELTEDDGSSLDL